MNWIRKEVWMVFLIVLAAVTLFFGGRASLYWQQQKMRLPPRLVNDSAVTLPVVEVLEKPSGLLRAKINFPEARIIYGDRFWETGPEGYFQIE